MGQQIDRKDRSAFVFITGVPFLVVAILVLWAGLYGLHELIGLFDSVSLNTYNYIKIIMSVVVMMFAVVSVSKGWLTEGLMFLLVGTSSLTTSSCIMLGFNNVNELDIVFGAAIIICSLFMIARKSTYRGYASFFTGLAIFLPSLINNETIGYISAGMLVASGVFFFIYFAIVMLYLETGDEKFSKSLGDPERGHVTNSYEIVLVVGFLIVGIMLFLDGITEFFDDVEWNTSIFIAVLILSIITISTAVYASLKGEAPEAMLILMISIYYLFTTILLFFKQVDAPIMVEIVTSAVILSTAMVFLKRHDWMLSMIAILACVQGLVISPFMGGNSALAGCFSITEALLCIYIALSIWCVVELKLEVLPITESFGGDGTDE